MSSSQTMSGNAGSQKQTQNPLNSKRPVQNPPHILALVIGINKYTGGSTKYNNLTGAVGDADAFEDFLTTKLQAPRENIYSLRDEQASRQGIIDGFHFLRDNQPYEKDDVEIVIYYAGHGAQDTIPADWEDWYTPTGRTQMLCPSDIGTQQKEGKDVVSIVSGIPYRTISDLLHQISSRKGSNITVILDCCSSAGMNRCSRGGKGYIPRQMNHPPVLHTTDRHIRETNMSALKGQGYLGRSGASCVFLAACGRDQVAWEGKKSKRGIFTPNLLKVLMSNEMETLTYRSLMDKLSMPIDQTPHCEGEGVNRLLFDHKGSSADTAFIYANQAQGGRMTLEAGSAQGITIGSRFAVHKMNLLDSQLLPNPCLGYLMVTSVNVFSSKLKLEPPPHSPQFCPPSVFYCKAADGVPHSLYIYLKEKTWLESMFLSDNQQTPLFNIVDDPTECNLELIIKDDTIYFDRHNDVVIPHIGSRLRHTVSRSDPATLRKVVNAARHFYYHLMRTAPNGAQDVRMEVRALQTGDFDDYADMRPVGENLIAKEPATIQVDDDSCFGINIFNDSDSVLYPYLFYFDPSDFTITEIYSPPLGAGDGRLMSNRPKLGVDAALPPKAHFTLGYGNGSKPWQFVVPDGQSKGIGFLRLFLSTRPSNFQSVVQESPFESSPTSGVIPRKSQVESLFAGSRSFGVIPEGQEEESLFKGSRGTRVIHQRQEGNVEEKWMVKTATIVQVVTRI